MREHRVEVHPYGVIDLKQYTVTRRLNDHVTVRFSGAIRDDDEAAYMREALVDEAWVRIYILTVTQKNMLRDIFDRLQATEGQKILAVAKYLKVKGVNWRELDKFLASWGPVTVWDAMAKLKFFKHTGIDAERALDVVKYWEFARYLKIAGLTKVDEVFSAISKLTGEDFFKIKMDPKEFSGFMRRNDFLERKELIFHGVIMEFSISYSDGGVKMLNAEAKSGSYMMDLLKHTRLFQKSDAAYKDILYTVAKPYREAGSADDPFIMRVEEPEKTIAEMDKKSADDSGGPPKTIIAQYKETDWEFIKRLASHFGTVVIPRCRSKAIIPPGGGETDEEKTDKAENIKFYFGLPKPKGQDAEQSAGFPFHGYQVIKGLALKRDVRRVRGANSSERYKVEDERELYDIGEAVNMEQAPGSGGLPLYISQSASTYVNSEMVHSYILKSKEALIQAKAFNDGKAILIIDDLKNWSAEFALASDAPSDDFHLKIEQTGDKRGWDSPAEKYSKVMKAASKDRYSLKWPSKPALAEAASTEVEKEALAGKSLLADVTKVYSKYVEVKADEDENLQEAGEADPKEIPWRDHFKRFPVSSIYASADGSGIHWMPVVGDRARINFPDQDEENGYVVSFYYNEKNLPANRTNPDNSSIKNPEGKEVLFSPTSICLTNNAGNSILLQEGDGIHAGSAGKITISSSGAVDVTGDQGITFSAPNGIAMRQGGAGMEVKRDKLVVKAAKASFSGSAQVGG